MMRLFFSLAMILSFALSASNQASAFTPKSLPPPTKNVYETLAANKKLSKFVSMINEAGLKDMFTVNSGEPVTVFAPENSTIEDIPSDVMKRINGSKASLQSFVKYHAIAGSMVSSGAIKGRRAAPASANGEALSFDGSDRTKPPKIGDGELQQADIIATNGIVHIVSSALIPPSLTQAPVASPTPPAPPAVPAAAAAPAAPATPAAATTTSSAAPPAPPAVHITTTGVAKAPAAAATTSVLAMPSTTSGSNTGFQLFGHKFSW